jgi:hypothetical protein
MQKSVFRRPGHWIALSLLAMVTSFVLHAAAAIKTSCTVSNVKYIPTLPRVEVTCSGSATVYIASVAVPGSMCAVMTPNGVDQTARFFQASMLSGRPVDIDYTTPCNTINSVIQK